ncbi:hypothetical protein NLM33_40555 [Bradyrhizobium sp. CCGUVB1N3]|uniref:hypothetical protein n=1 Tax=Bradyrhizobium sp. CCGUVB1N3 TaxID=2949629 RepID=UPI0020B43A3B|nr:hypothetical protein [Bradyrhizobium sp. CCGUVB1N3]MCP3476504.1 hypothetical protein [Bradyrhizobium sp. CCGUVB1N3]
MPSFEGKTSGEREIADSELFDLVVAADEEALSEGLSPKQRGLATVRKVLKKLGHAFVMTGSGMSPLGERVLAMHRSLYRGSDLAIGGIHGGIYMFRDVFARIYIPFGYGQMSVNPFQLTDLSETQLRWLASLPGDLAAFHDQFIDIFDFAGTMGRLGDYKMPPKEAQELFQLASFQLQAAAAALSVAFDFRGAIQSSLIGAELALKAGLAAQGVIEKERRKHWHDLASAAKAFSTASQAFDLDRVLRTVQRLPQYVENRYSPEQPDRMAVGHIVMGAQYIAGEVARQIGEFSIRSALTPPAQRVYPT